MESKHWKLIHSKFDMKNLPDLEAWAIFSTVVEEGSFAKAALALGISQATVSKAITRLETRLQTTLFHRTSRRVTMTESGRSALPRADKLRQEGEAVEAEITEQAARPRGLVRMAVPMSFGLGHVAPLLPEFMTRYPDITLELHFSDGITDLVEQGMDLALRIAALTDSSMRARRICTVNILLVAAPKYFANRERPGHPADLARHTGLLYTRSRAGSAWHFLHPDHGEYAIAMSGPLRVDNADALMPVLLAGGGLAMQPEFIVWRELRNGSLENVLPQWQVPPISLNVVLPPGRRRPARVNALANFLAERLATAPWASGV